MNRIKYIFLIATFISIHFSTVLCQHIDSLKNQAGISMLSYKYGGKDEAYFYFDKTLHSFNSISYHRMHKQIVTRYAFSYDSYKTNVNQDQADGYTGYDKYSMWNFAVGIQKLYRYNYFRYYIGIDFYNSLVNHVVKLDGGPDGNGFSLNVLDNWIGISPVIGIEYFVMPQISITAELSFNVQGVVYSSRWDRSVSVIQSYVNNLNALSLCYNF